MCKPAYILLFFLLFCFLSCKKTPSWVIDRDDMESVLVDVHIADALVQDDNLKYNTFEQKEALYNAVLKKHGITKQQLDISIYWYAQHSELYVKMYEKITKRLADRNTTIEKLVDALAVMPAINGDTINIWYGKDRQTFTSFFPQQQMFSYKIKTDTSFYAQDVYKLKMHLSGLISTDSLKVLPQAVVVFKYPNDSSFVVTKDITKNGAFEFEIPSDSIVPENIFAGFYLNMQGKPHRIFMDSVRLLRMHKPIEVASDTIK